MVPDAPSGSVGWDELSQIPGSLPKPPSKRDKSKGRKVGGSSLTTYAKLAPKNKERAASKREENFGPQAAACERLPCYACAIENASRAHHEPPQARGGTDRDTVPLWALTRLHGMPGCHQRRHDKGEVTFWSELGKTPAEAKAHAREQAGITCYD